MTSVLQADYEKLLMSANKMGLAADTVQQVWQRLERSTGQLIDGGWEGEGSQAFFGSMHDMLFPAMARLVTALQAIQDTLRISEQGLKMQKETNVSRIKFWEYVKESSG